MNREQLKHALMSILIGACVAFLSTLLSDLANFLKNNSTEIIAGSAAAFHHIARNARFQS